MNWYKRAQGIPKFKVGDKVRTFGADAVQHSGEVIQVIPPVIPSRPFKYKVRKVNDGYYTDIDGSTKYDSNRVSREMAHTLSEEILEFDA